MIETADHLIITTVRRARRGQPREVHTAGLGHVFMEKQQTCAAVS